MVSNSICLIVDCILLFICIMQILANLMVLVVWIMDRKLRTNDNLILLISLAFIDFVYAVLQFPYLIILILGWRNDDEVFDYNPYLIVRLGGPSAALMKSGCTVTTFIAVDRLLAQYIPLHYYSFCKRRWCTLASIFALFMAFIDWVALQVMVDIGPVPGCSSFGCFTSKSFREYWGLSNMFMNFLSTLLTLIIIYHNCQRRSSDDREKIEKMNRLKIDRGANRAAYYILTVSALIGVVPGCLNFVATFSDLSIIHEVLFFVGTCATLSGLAHAFIFAMAHNEIRSAILKRFGLRDRFKTVLPVSWAKKGLESTPKQSTSLGKNDIYLT